MQQWFTTPPVPGLSTVYKSPRVLMGGKDFAAPAGVASDAVAFPWIHTDDEYRETSPVNVGWKATWYEVSLYVMFRSARTPVVGGGEDMAELAMDDYDATIEAIKTRIRQDQTMGGMVFCSGEGDAQHGHILVSSELPMRSDDGTVWIRNQVTWWVQVWFTG
jgi:hypothetical protein